MKKISNISIVIPVFNEEKNIVSLLKEIKIALKNKIEYEVLIIDDGSDDNTVKSIYNNMRQFQNLSIVVHKKNYGQSISLLTGISKAKFELDVVHLTVPHVSRH